MPNLLSTILLLLLSVESFAQSTERFYNITRRDGLASGSITSIVQDQQGLIWLGTKKGLNRYDGSDFIHFHTGNSEITSNDISSLKIDHENQLWIGTFGDGLHRLNLSTEKIEKAHSRYIGNKVVTSHLDEDSTLWILSDKGLCQRKSEITPMIEVSAALKNRGSALSKIDTSIWVGTFDGNLYQVSSEGKFAVFSLNEHGPNINIQKIHPYTENKILIGTRQHGLLVFNLDNLTIEKVAIEAVDIRDIITDKSGVIWIGTDGHGIYKMKDSTTNHYANQAAQIHSLVSNAVQVCFEDRDANLWFGTAWDGISLLDHRLEDLRFYYGDFKGLKQLGVLTIHKEDGNLWFGTDGSGISVEKETQINNNILRATQPSTYIQVIEKIDDSYWIGTFQSGFYIISGEKVEHYTSNTGLTHDDVRSILRIDQTNFLIATWGGGLSIFNRVTKKFERLKSSDNEPKDIVTLYRLNKKEILIGTFGQGVHLLNLENFSCKRILSNLHNVVSIDQTKKGVWFGTWGEGLHLANKPFRDSKPIFSDVLDQNTNIVSILSAPDQNDIWLATTEKILKIKENSQITEMSFPSQQYHLNASYYSDEEFSFGGTDGVISFRADKVSLTIPKPVEILDVRVLNEKLPVRLDESEMISFDHDQNMITFGYATPTFPVSRDETYEVRLNPSQKNWVHVGTQRAMTYADLKPGTYEFMVRNIASDASKSFRFEILRPWWKTWWAYIIVSFLFLALLYSFRKYSVNLERIRNQLEIEKMGREKDVEISDIKQRFFVNVSHEIRTPLTLIIGEIEQLAMKVGSSKTITHSLGNLRNNGNHLLQLVNELLDFRKMDQEGIRLKVGKGNFVNFCREIYLSFLSKAEAQSIHYEFICNESTIPLWYDRDQLEKVFFNLISNAFKNTPQTGSIKFIINQAENEVTASVVDTGKGISNENLKDVFKRFYQKESDHEADRTGFGIGLSIVEEITILHHGSVSVESEENKGSRFDVKLKKGKEHFSDEQLLQQFISSESLEGYQSSEEPDVNSIEVTKSEAQILIVEDNPEIRRLLVASLSSQFTVIEAHDGKMGHDMSLEHLPDLIVSDVMMPGLDGITLTQKLRKNPVSSHIPIILLTARTATVFKKEGFETGADDYVTKPFSPSLLITRITNILQARENLKLKIRNEIATKPEDLNVSTPDERFLKELVHILQTHLGNSELNSELVAAEMGMSHSVIYKKIKALTGLNLVEFVRDYRLQQAGQMLLKYKLSVAEACYKVGFSDKKYFTQIFKKKYGVTPSAYAKGKL